MRYRDGRWGDVGSRPWQWPVVDFGPGCGRRRTMPMEFDELYPLPEQLPGLRGLGVSTTMDAATNVASSIVVAALSVTGPRPAAVRAYSRPLAWTSRTFTRPPYGCVVLVVAEGTRTGRDGDTTVRIFCEDSYTLTASAGESMAEQLLDRTAVAPGVHRMGLVVNPIRLLADLTEMGAGVDIT